MIWRDSDYLRIVTGPTGALYAARKKHDGSGYRRAMARQMQCGIATILRMQHFGPPVTPAIRRPHWVVGGVWGEDAGEAPWWDRPLADESGPCNRISRARLAACLLWSAAVSCAWICARIRRDAVASAKPVRHPSRYIAGRDAFTARIVPVLGTPIVP